MYYSSKIISTGGIKHLVKWRLSIKKDSETCTKSSTVATNIWEKEYKTIKSYGSQSIHHCP